MSELRTSLGRISFSAQLYAGCGWISPDAFVLSSATGVDVARLVRVELGILHYECVKCAMAKPKEVSNV